LFSINLKFAFDSFNGFHNYIISHTGKEVSRAHSSVG
jgi:hypothetical protein